MQRKDHYFKTSKGDFHYIDWGGDGPLLHLSHATGLCAGLYSPFVSGLREHFHVIGMDDRGHGKTRAEADPQKLKDWNIFVEDLERFLEQFNQPVIAMGHSRGGVVNLLLAIKRPDLIRALILIDPTFLPPSWMGPWRLVKLTGLAKYVPIAARAAKRKRVWPDTTTIIQAYQGRGMFRAWQDGFLEAYIADGTETTGNGAIQLTCAPAWESRCFATCPHDIWRYVPQLRQPALVVYGADSDTFLPAAVARFKRDAPLAVFAALENTGHFVPMERPDETAGTIFTFLKEKQIR